jgi:hypothetical protein
MATNEYILNIESEGKTNRFRLKYKNGSFSSLERIYGFLPDVKHKRLMVLCPQNEMELTAMALQYSGRGVFWEKVEKDKTTHAVFIEKYDAWYFERIGIQPLIKPQDAQAVKWIKNALIKLSGTEADAIKMWDIILQSWDKQDKWYVSQTELTQIKRNLNIILKTLKYGKSTQEAERKARNVSDDYRQNL